MTGRSKTHIGGGGLCDRGSQTHVGTTDISPLVKDIHTQNEPAGQVDVPTTVEFNVKGEPRHV